MAYLFYLFYLFYFICYYLWIPQIGSLIPNRGVSKKLVADTKYKKDEKRKKTNKKKGERIRMIGHIVG